ncbi:hypothetical protein [Neptunitalea lumnitzerae]|nr:hypothetical protein [Neptunitalea sp. Y10]
MQRVEQRHPLFERVYPRKKEFKIVIKPKAFVNLLNSKLIHIKRGYAPFLIPLNSISKQALYQKGIRALLV